jgi:hypothetical protein
LTIALNSAVGIFTVQFKNEAGKWRTAAQSVITPTMQLDRSGSWELDWNETEGWFHKNRDWRYHEDCLAVQVPRTLCCDSIETSGSFRSAFGGDAEALIATAYQEALKSYMDAYGDFLARERESFVRNHAIFGAMGAEAEVAANLGFETRPNLFVSVPAVGYSDKYGENVVTFPLTRREGVEI